MIFLQIVQLFQLLVISKRAQCYNVSWNQKSHQKSLADRVRPNPPFRNLVDGYDNTLHGDGPDNTLHGDGPDNILHEDNIVCTF